MGLDFLYHNVLGRMILKLLCMPWISKLSGKLMDTGLSKRIIPSFIKNNNIDMSEYIKTDYACFNEFFCRHIKPECREIDYQDYHFIAPCDGLLSAYSIHQGLVVPVKQSYYRIADLLQDEALAKEYDEGICLVYRLCVNHYHRYHYLDTGTRDDYTFIPGILHTVQPIALREVPVFVENSREYTVLHTENFDDIVQIEVGAMLVGKIVNDGKVNYHRGDEKGHFEYGGSTIILLIKKNQVVLDEKLFEDTKKEIETPVKMGMQIGMKAIEK